MGCFILYLSMGTGIEGNAIGEIKVIELLPHCPLDSVSFPFMKTKGDNKEPCLTPVLTSKLSVSDIHV